MSRLKPYLPYEKEQIVAESIVNLQKERKGGGITAGNIQDLLKEEFKVDYGISGVILSQKRGDRFTNNRMLAQTLWVFDSQCLNVA